MLHFYEGVLALSRTFMSESELRQAHTGGTQAMSARRVLLLNGLVSCDAGGAVLSTTDAAAKVVLVVCMVRLDGELRVIA